MQRVGYVPVGKLQRAGFAVGDPAAPPQGIIAFRQWWIAAREITRWKNQLLVALGKHTQDNPLAAGMPRKAAMDALDLQEDALLGIAVAAAKVEQVDGVLRLPGYKVDLGAAEASVAKLEAWLADDPFAAPEADELQELRLGAKQLAAAENAGDCCGLARGSFCCLVRRRRRKSVSRSWNNRLRCRRRGRLCRRRAGWPSRCWSISMNRVLPAAWMVACGSCGSVGSIYCKATLKYSNTKC